jgi:hypothetical protein
VQDGKGGRRAGGREGLERNTEEKWRSEEQAWWCGDAETDGRERTEGGGVQARSSGARPQGTKPARDRRVAPLFPSLSVCLSPCLYLSLALCSVPIISPNGAPTSCKTPSSPRSFRREWSVYSRRRLHQGHSALRYGSLAAVRLCREAVRLRREAIRLRRFAASSHSAHRLHPLDLPHAYRFLHASSSSSPILTDATPRAFSLAPSLRARECTRGHASISMGPTRKGDHARTHDHALARQLNTTEEMQGALAPRWRRR